MNDPPVTMKEAAHSLGVSPRWLQEYVKTIPCCYLQMGRKKLFDRAALAAIETAMRRTALECHSRSSRLNRGARRSTAFVDASSESELTEALKLASKGTRYGSYPNGARKLGVRR